MISRPSTEAPQVRLPDRLRTQWTMGGAFRCRFVASRCVASECPERTSRGTIGSKQFHPLRKLTYRTGWLCERTQPVRC